MTDSPRTSAFRELMARTRRSLARLDPVAKRSSERKRREHIELVRSSAYFDEAWYLARYPDVAAAGADPARHFVDVGWREGRDPGPDFATSGYLKANADVARSGTNPLVHFLEFGQSEGREVPAHHGRRRRRRADDQPLAPAAPVFRGDIAREQPQPWLQWYRLDREDERLFSAGKWPVGYGGDSNALQAAFGQLQALSGYGDSDSGRPAGVGFGGFELSDAWFVNEGLLRIRWTAPAFPFVLRAYQHDALAAGALAFVGERLIQSPLDFADISVTNPYFPILFLFAEPQGVVAGASLLPFPSLSRGGVHYSELVALSGTEGRDVDPMAVGLDQMTRLLRARDSRSRLVASIAIDPSGADGLSPLVQKGFKAWLERVARVPVRPLEEDAPESEGGTLVLTSDMVPTIAALAGEGRPGSDSAFLSLIAADPDPSQPAVLAEVPPGAPELIATTAPGFPAPWPRWRGAKGEGTASGAAAIRIGEGRPLSDAELLVPVSGAALPSGTREALNITWLVPASDRPPEDAIATLRSIAAQTGGNSHLIGFIGEPHESVREAAAKLFRGRVRTYKTLASAARQSQSSYVGLIAEGVVLHDRRASEFLLSMLDDPAVATAGCALVASEKRGKSWHVTAVDLPILPPERVRMGADLLARHFWRACCPVVQPPQDLWLASTPTVRGWFAPKRAEAETGGLHMLTTLVTGSHPGPKAQRPALDVPPADEEQSIRTKVLFG